MLISAPEPRLPALTAWISANQESSWPGLGDAGDQRGPAGEVQPVGGHHEQDAAEDAEVGAGHRVAGVAGRGEHIAQHHRALGAEPVGQQTAERGQGERAEGRRADRQPHAGDREIGGDGEEVEGQREEETDAQGVDAQGGDQQQVAPGVGQRTGHGEPGRRPGRRFPTGRVIRDLGHLSPPLSYAS